MRVLVNQTLPVFGEEPYEGKGVQRGTRRLRRPNAVGGSLVQLAPHGPVGEPAELEDDELDAW